MNPGSINFTPSRIIVSMMISVAIFYDYFPVFHFAFIGMNSTYSLTKVPIVQIFYCMLLKNISFGILQFPLKVSLKI